MGMIGYDAASGCFVFGGEVRSEGKAALNQGGFELLFHQFELLREAVQIVPVVKMELDKVAVLLHLDRRDIVGVDHVATKVTKFGSFDAHKPSFHIGLDD